MLVLPVEGQRPPTERPQVGGRCGAALEEGGRPAGHPDPPAEHDLVLPGKPLRDLGQLRIVAHPVGSENTPST